MGNPGIDAVSVLGLNHRSAPVAVRERVAVTDERLREFLRHLLPDADVREAVALSTCNRVEVYVTAKADTVDIAALSRAIASFHDLGPDELEPYLYRFDGASAARHLFRVAASLDSMFVGEKEILGQVRTAYASAIEAGTVGRILHRLFQSALHTAKEVRAHLRFPDVRVSTGSRAAQLALELLRDVKDPTVVIIGCGEVARAVATALAESAGRRGLVFVNRTFEKAREMAQVFAGRCERLQRLADAVAGADVVLTCTGSPVPVVDVRVARVAAAKRRDRRAHEGAPEAPLVFIDIAVPRNVEAAVTNVEGVRLYDIDDLRKVASTSADRLPADFDRSNELIDAAVARFETWVARRRAHRAVALLAKSFDETRRREVDRAVGKLAGDKRAQRVLESLSLRLTSKLLDGPAQKLKSLNDESFSAQEYELIARIFNGSDASFRDGADGTGDKRDEVT